MNALQFRQAYQRGQLDQFGSLLLFHGEREITDEEIHDYDTGKYSLPFSVTVERLKASVKPEEVIEAGFHAVKNYFKHTAGSYECILPDPQTKKITPIDLERNYTMQIHPFDDGYKNIIGQVYRDPKFHFNYETVPMVDENTDARKVTLALNASNDERPVLQWRFKALVNGVEQLFIGSIYQSVVCKK